MDLKIRDVLKHIYVVWAQIIHAKQQKMAKYAFVTANAKLKEIVAVIILSTVILQVKCICYPSYCQGV